MSSLSGNFFTILTLIAAPAVLTNATSVLALNTANRFGRVIDRSRLLANDIERGIADPDYRTLRVRQLERLGRRGLLLMRAQTAFYLALGSFVATALASVMGAVVSASYPAAEVATGLIGLVMGTGAAASLIYGCVLLVRETRIAVTNLTDESTQIHAFLERERS